MPAGWAGSQQHRTRLLPRSARFHFGAVQRRPAPPRGDYRLRRSTRVSPHGPADGRSTAATVLHPWALARPDLEVRSTDVPDPPASRHRRAASLTAVLGLQLTACDAIYEPGKVYRLDTISWLAGINDAGVAVGTWGWSGRDLRHQAAGQKAGVSACRMVRAALHGHQRRRTRGRHLVDYGPPREQAFVYNSKTGGIRVIQLPCGFNMTTSVAVDDVGRVLLSGCRRWDGPRRGRRQLRLRPPRPQPAPA